MLEKVAKDIRVEKSGSDSAMLVIEFNSFEEMIAGKYHNDITNPLLGLTAKLATSHHRFMHSWCRLPCVSFNIYGRSVKKRVAESEEFQRSYKLLNNPYPFSSEELSKLDYLEFVIDAMAEQGYINKVKQQELLAAVRHIYSVDNTVASSAAATSATSGTSTGIPRAALRGVSGERTAISEFFPAHSAVSPKEDVVTSITSDESTRHTPK